MSWSVSALAGMLVLGGPPAADAQSLAVRTCSDKPEFQNLFSQDKHTFVGYFDRGPVKDKGYLATYITASTEGGHWYLIVANKPAAEVESADTKFCIVDKGTRLEIVDYVSYKEAFENPIPFELNGKPGTYNQGFVYWYSVKQQRKAWATLEEAGRTPTDMEDPNIVELMGWTFDVRDEAAACTEAKRLWKSEEPCGTYSDIEFINADLGWFVAMRGESQGSDDQGAYILSVLTNPTKKTMKLLRTTPRGATIEYLSGKNFGYRGWAIKQ